MIFIPEIKILDNNKFQNPGRIIHDYIGLKCAFCGEKGATLCCCYNNTENYYNPLNLKCKNRYHYLCAIKSGCVISSVTYNVLCPKHIVCGFPKRYEEAKVMESIPISIEKINEDEKMNLDTEENNDNKEKENINNDNGNGNDISLDKNENEDNIIKKKNCFYCQLIINEEESIQCSKCKNYFHESCVGISNKKNDYDINENELDEKDFICPDCLSVKKQ